MKIAQILTVTASLAGTAVILSAQSITLDFENNLVTGGDLVIQTAGTDAVDDFTGDRFDEQSSALFQIQNIATIGTLGVTATALIDDLNVTGSGLQDGASGYNGAGEGTSFLFDTDVIITSLDWVSFTSLGSDSVTLSVGATSIGTFGEGTVIGNTDFTSTNPATMNIAVSAGDAFTITFDNGAFYLGQMGFTVVPEPNAYALLSGICALASIMLRRRSVN